MSKEFIQHVIYPTKLEYYMKEPRKYEHEFYNTTNKYVIELPKEEMYSEHPTILILPKHEHRGKTIVECCLNLLVKHGIHNIKGDYSLKEYGVHNKFMIMLHALSRVLGYLVNCTSWEEQKVHEFDTRELNHRMTFCKLTPEED